jgi:hypothetical protein
MDLDYLRIREGLLQDSLRDQRIHHWISSQYDFALSEFEGEDHPQNLTPSRADSPLLGFSEIVATSASGGKEAAAPPCPSYDPLFYAAPSQQDNLTAAEQEFEDNEREKALKFLIQEMNLGRVFPCAGGAQRHNRNVSGDREKVNTFRIN